MKLAIFPLILTLVAGCDVGHVQTSSGAAFMADRGQISDRGVLEAAIGEPDLHFPAKIGIARIVGGSITAPPQAELAKFAGDRPSPDPLGQFSVVSPLIANTLTDVEPYQNEVRMAQLTAARQHLDYVLIYTLDREGGGFTTTGRAEAMLMDVRSGYVYGTASAAANVSGYGSIRRGWGDRILTDEAAAKVVSTLAPDVAEMFNQLYARAQSS